jgi:hypothetical protein
MRGKGGKKVPWQQLGGVAGELRLQADDPCLRVPPDTGKHFTQLVWHHLLKHEGVYVFGGWRGQQKEYYSASFLCRTHCNADGAGVRKGEYQARIVRLEHRIEFFERADMPHLPAERAKIEGL